MTTTTVNDALRAAIPRLREAGIDDPARDARLLLAHALQVPSDRLTLHSRDVVSPATVTCFAALIDARICRRPVSQIIGYRLFWGRRFRVTQDVLDPRPDTETLIACALRSPARRFLDLGTGTGAILLTLLAEWPDATGTGSDISPAALAVAQANADTLGLATRATLILSDWFYSVSGRYDLIVANPPYIAEADLPHLAPEVRDHEPRLALTPGGDGLDAYRAIATGAPAHLAPQGRLLVEIGPTQGPAVCAIFAEAGFGSPAILPDLDGRDRVVAARGR